MNPQGKPLFSIITITFNAGETIVPTIESLNRQSFQDFEHIIIDGASSDNTLARIRELSNSTPRILSEPDNGLYFAMNKGLNIAKGKYLLFLNAGDSLHSPDSLRYYADASANDPDIIYADTNIVNEDRTFNSPRHLSAPEVLTLKSFSKGMLICHQAFMVKRSIAPLYDTDYRFSADYDWTVRCIAASSPEKCINLHKVTIDYLRNGTTDKNKRASLIERFHIMSHHYGSLPTIARHLSFIPRAATRRLKAILQR
ncbi:MAG: glycosyltransferase [Muribaculaceae bacterium]|nr:glycosyltransferase [Muribaculaceae bacterium]